MVFEERREIEGVGVPKLGYGGGTSDVVVPWRGYCSVTECRNADRGGVPCTMLESRSPEVESYDGFVFVCVSDDMTGDSAEPRHVAMTAGFGLCVQGSAQVGGKQRNAQQCR